MDMHTGLAHPKGKTRKQVSAKAERHAGDVLRATYKHCFNRESEGCAVLTRLPMQAAGMLVLRFGSCGGPLQLMHLAGHRRSHTRGLPPELRHDPKRCLMACQNHHDAEEHKGLRFVGSDPALGMDSPSIDWWVAPQKVNP